MTTPQATSLYLTKPLRSEEEARRDTERERCPECGGAGWVVAVRPACCGNVYPSGECKGDCAVPEQYQEQCESCNGSGFIPAREEKERQSDE